MEFRRSQLEFSTDLPALSAGRSVLFYDQVLLQPARVGAPQARAFKLWASKFPVRYPLKAGESLKEVRGLPALVTRLLKDLSGLPGKPETFVAVGGGSVGDVVGFLASICKRGVPLIQIPSTWVAALDSAHGGKTAMNVGGFKNQIGTFYPAEKIYLVKSLLMSQPAKRAEEAYGELAKIALIDGGDWADLFQKTSVQGGELIWKYLRPAIEAKYKIVLKDPFETQGLRRCLNLGHTMGHVLEALQKVPHGRAVGKGLLFSLEWSRNRKVLSQQDFDHILPWLKQNYGIAPGISKKIPLQKLKRAVAEDKKVDSSGQVNFVFLKSAGNPQVEPVSVEEVVKEALRQGWSSSR
ncbi:hypothetical protein K2X30_06890 [bacterium]|nr:hypothetical protein [bacterium]